MLLTLGVYAMLSATLWFGSGPGLGSPAPPVVEPSSRGDFYPVGPHLGQPLPDTAEVRLALEALERAIGQWKSAPPTDRSAVLLAARKADEALATLPTLGDWRPLLNAELWAKAGDTAAVRVALGELTPGSGLLDRWGWRAQVEGFERAGDANGAQRAAVGYATAGLSASAASAAWLRAGELALTLRDTASARSALGNALAAGPRDGSAQTAARALARLPGNRDPHEDVWLGRVLLAAGAWDEADRRLTPLLDHADLRLRDDLPLLVELGRALVELRRYPAALQLLAPLVAPGVPGEVAGPALFWRGRASLAAGRVADAESSFRALAERSPASSLAEEGLLLLVEREPLASPTPRTLGLMEALFGTGILGSRGSLAAMQVGTGRFLRGDLGGAATFFDRYSSGSRAISSRQQAVYWAGLAYDRVGDENAARSRFQDAHREDPFSFYGLMAGERIGAPVLDPGLPPGPEPGPVPAVEFANALVRLRVHQIVSTVGSFAFELDRLTRSFTERGGAYDFAEAMNDGGFSMQGIVLGRDIRRQEPEWNLRLLRIVHPFPYREVIVAQARERGVDPFMVAGLIRQESMFVRAIQSSAGAVGLMQLMPATAREVAGTVGLRYAPEILSDPYANVRMGTTYFSSLLRRFDGRVVDALVAYNAGPSRIQQWRSRPDYADPAVFVENIPIAETRNYVKVVQLYGRVYAALYGCSGFQPCIGL